MARITVEDCLRKVPNRFMLVNMVAKRVRQIREGSEYLVSSPKNEDIVVALREVAAEKIVIREAEAVAAEESLLEEGTVVDEEAAGQEEPGEEEAPEAEEGSQGEEESQEGV